MLFRSANLFPPTCVQQNILSTTAKRHPDKLCIFGTQPLVRTDKLTLAAKGGKQVCAYALCSQTEVGKAVYRERSELNGNEAVVPAVVSGSTLVSGCPCRAMFSETLVIHPASSCECPRTSGATTPMLSWTFWIGEVYIN